jgi:glycine/D-amino acid oxidase-like deaminating enzyme
VRETADVVIVGGGAVGASAAYHLADAGAGRILLLEREASLGTGSTGRCAGGFRHQFSSRINIELSLASVPLITGFTEQHGLPLDVDQDGYLFLVRSEPTWQSFLGALELQRSMGVAVEVLTPEEAAGIVPGIATEDMIGALFGPRDGIADPSGLTNGYATLSRRAGAEIRTGVEVTGVRTHDGHVTGVATTAGDIDAPVVVNAAGPWAGVLAATAGVALPLEPIPRQVAVTGPFPGAPERRTLVIDADTTFYFHKEGPGVLMGMGGGPNERSSFDISVDDAFIAEQVVPTALRIFPPIEEAGIATTWAGLYEMTPDRHPVIGPAPGVEGFLLANGFSGHGFQHAPIVGKLLAELVVDGRAHTVDIAPLLLERFAGGQPVRERHVI